MAPTQLTFTLRTSPNCKTVHLIGNWDGYKGQLPLSKDSSKTGGWKGTFRFQTSTLKPGSRYWYYYMLDGHFVSHDPAHAFTVEPTTSRKLNILDVPKGKSDSSSHSMRRNSKNIPLGRALSPSRILCPQPQKPNAAPNLELKVGQFSGHRTVASLTRQFAATHVSSFSDTESDSSSDIDDSASDVPSLSSSSGNSPTSSVSGSSLSSRSSSRSSCCTCERYGITRKGHRVLLDCGGSRCGSSDSSSSCASDSEPEVLTKRRMATRRQGVVIRQGRR